VNILKRPAVSAKTGESKSQIYAGIKAGTFPPPIELGENSVGWVEHEIDAYLQAKVNARDKALAAGIPNPRRGRGRKPADKPNQLNLTE
jgi:prophage regulatory protein